MRAFEEDNAVTVSVDEGSVSVRVKNDGSTTDLAAGKALRVASDGTVNTLDDATRSLVFAWVRDTLAFVDAASGQALDPATRITSATLAVNGQVVADKAAMSQLPKTVQLTGEALSQVKAKIDARQPASVRSRCVLVIPTTPPPPARLKIDYDAQPAIILGPGKLF